MSQSYLAQFPLGTRVRAADREDSSAFNENGVSITRFKPTTSHAGSHAVVSDVGFYHGGDVLYTLENVPGVWHERCLEKA